MPDVTTTFAALADPTRRAIFERIARGETAVGALAAHFPVSRPAVSQHLRVLKDAALVRDRREGNRVLYAVDRRGIDSLRDYVDRLDRMWPRALDAFKRVVGRAPMHYRRELAP